MRLSRLNPRNMPGPGDEESWGPCTNHPNDPRTPDAPEPSDAQLDQALAEYIDDNLDPFMRALNTDKDDIMAVELRDWFVQMCNLKASRRYQDKKQKEWAHSFSLFGVLYSRLSDKFDEPVYKLAVDTIIKQESQE